MHDLTA